MITAAPQNTTPTCQPHDKVVNFKHGSCLNAEEKVIPAASEKVVLKHFFSTKTAPEILSARFEKFLSDLWTDKEAHHIEKIIKSSEYLRFFIALKLLSASSLDDKTLYCSGINKVPAYEKLEHLLFYILDMLYEAKLMKEGRSDNEVMTKREVQEILKLCKENESELLKIHDLKKILSYSSKDQIELILECENEFRQLVPSANKTSLKCIEYLKDNIGFAVLLDDIASSSVKRTKLIEMTEGEIGQVIQKNEDFEARFNIYIPEEINGNDKPRKHEKTYNSDVSSFIRQALLHPSGFMRLVIFIVFVFFIMPTAAAVSFRHLQRRSNENNNEQKPNCSDLIASGEELNRLCSSECVQKHSPIHIESLHIESLVPMSQAPNCNGKNVIDTNFIDHSPDAGFKLAKGVKLREIANSQMVGLTIDGSQKGSQLTEESSGNGYLKSNIKLGGNSHLAQRSSKDVFMETTIEGQFGTCVFDRCNDIYFRIGNITNAQLCQHTNGDTIGAYILHNSLPEGGSTFGTAMVDSVQVDESSVDGGGLANELTVKGKANITLSTHNGQLAETLDASSAKFADIKMLSTGDSSGTTVFIAGNGELRVKDTRLHDANQICPTDTVQIKGVEASTKCQTESASSALDSAYETFCTKRESALNLGFELDHKLGSMVLGRTTEQIKRQCARVEELRQDSTNKNNRCITKGGKAYIEMNHIDCISTEITSTQADTTEKSSKLGRGVGAGIGSMGIGIGIVAIAGVFAAALDTCVKIRRKKAQKDQQPLCTKQKN